MSDSLVTILIPVYNVEAYLPQCLDSVTGQTYKHLQIVAIDDGSSDGSWDILRKYASRDDRIEIYRQENQGVAATRNHLLEQVKGEYILFVDSDDWIEEDMVESLLALANEYEAPIVMCDRIIIDAKPNIKPQNIKVLTKEEAIRDFLRHEFFNGSLWNKLIKTSLLHNERFHCGISYGEDALFCWRILQNVSKVVVTDKQLYHYRMNENSISHATFGPQKMSGHKVWSLINISVFDKYPEYLNLAQARWAVQDTQLIRDAAHANYPYGPEIIELQQTVKRYHSRIRIADITSIKMVLFSYFVSRFYFIAKLC